MLPVGYLVDYWGETRVVERVAAKVGKKADGMVEPMAGEMDALKAEKWVAERADL